MKKILVAGLVCFAAACSSSDDNDDSVDPNLGLGGGDFDADATIADYKTSDDFFTLSGGLLPSDSVHGDNQIWYSNTVKEFVGGSGFTAPVGTAAIKEFDTDKDGTVDGLAVMIKREAGFDAANNDWYYDYREADGTLKDSPAPGAIPMCISCHGKFADQDYLPGLVMQNPNPADFVTNYRSASNFFTLTDGLVSGNSPHKDNQIWYSRGVEAFVGADTAFTAPEGTVAIKEFDGDLDGTVDGIAVMIKKEAGYDAENGDWYYDMRAVDGTILDTPAPGKIEMCIACHAKFPDQDYLPGLKILAP